MINITAKSASIALGIGGITTGAVVGGYQMLKSSKEEEAPKTTPKEKQSIKSLLDTAGIKLLTKDQDKSVWKPKWQAFQNKHKQEAETTPEGAWKFKDWNKDKSSADAPEEFKELCTNNGEKLVDDEKDTLFEQVKEFCTENKPAN